MPIRQYCIFLLTLALIACGGGGDTTAPQPVRPSNTTCIAGASISFAGVRRVNAFPNLSFAQPLAMLPAPSGNLLYVVERGGTIQVFDNDPTVTTMSEFGDISARVSTAAARPSRRRSTSRVSAAIPAKAAS